MRRFAMYVLIVLGMMGALVAPARADLTWCKKDPLITLNGVVVDLSVAIPWKYVPLVNGPVRYTVTTPAGVSRHVILNDFGYNGYGSKVVFADSNETIADGVIPTHVRVSVPIDKSGLAPGEVVPAELSIIVEDLTLISVQGTAASTSTNVDISGLLNSILD